MAYYARSGSDRRASDRRREYANYANYGAAYQNYAQYSGPDRRAGNDRRSGQERRAS